MIAWTRQTVVNDVVAAIAVLWRMRELIAPFFVAPEIIDQPLITYQQGPINYTF